jgi:hypothetical protein
MYMPHWQSGPSCLSVVFCVAGLRWVYFNPPQHGWYSPKKHLGFYVKRPLLSSEDDLNKIWKMASCKTTKYHKIKVCDEGTLVKILCFWTLSIVLFYLKHRPVYISKHNVSETGFCLRLHVKSTQLGPIDRASPYQVTWLKEFVPTVKLTCAMRSRLHEGYATPSFTILGVLINL